MYTAEGLSDALTGCKQTTPCVCSKGQDSRRDACLCSVLRILILCEVYVRRELSGCKTVPQWATIHATSLRG